MPDVPEAALALWLADRSAGQGDTMFIARSETRLDRLARACAGFCLGRVELLVLPPWDVLPYDRAAPSAEIVGRRVRTLVRLGEGGTRHRLLLIGADAALQLVPAASAWAGAVLGVAVGEALDVEAFRTGLGARGYRLDEAVSDPGEVAFRGQVIDVFPAADAEPVRMALEDGRVVAMHRFDPVSQRRLGAVEAFEIHPAVEFPLDVEGAEGAEEALEQDETAPLSSGRLPPLSSGRLPPLPSGRLVPVFDYARGFAVAMDDETPGRWEELRAQATDAYEASRKLVRVEADPRGVLPRPGRLYLTPERALALCADRVTPEPVGEAETPPRDVGELVRRARDVECAVVIAAPGDAAKLARSLVRRGLEARAAADWAEAVQGGVACLPLDLDEGLRREELLVLSAAGLVRAARAEAGLGGEETPRAGDVVVHLEHGAARLAGLKHVETEGGERLALAFAGGSELLVDVGELDRVWRYGSEGGLDRIDGAAWRAKRAEIDGEIAAVAERLAEAAAARAAARMPAMEWDRAAYGRLARRFPHALSGDQRAAVEAVLGDLRSGRLSDRLVCGDVGFGKTEVALRAAAAAALAGWQVAVVAPTTVLARQHLETFRRRFAGTEVRVEGLIGPESTKAGPEGRAIRAGLAEGRVGVVVGTQAVAGERVRFARLGLVVVDEEQRFGEGQKRAFEGKGGGGGSVHRLAMTATPIPRTLQMAMVGLRDVSVIRTAPLRRQATRTFVLPFDPVIARDALLREQGRGGQSFVVCPRISDLEPMAARLAELVPRLRVVQAHGRMKPAALEDAVMGFARGEGDVLLATNIIEAGLDIPRANTIIVMQPDRFGLAQLHQVRGRVGRGGRRGTAYLLTEPGRRLARATMARLKALEALGSLGAGVEISAADLDQRGAGQLFGEAQAGHVSAIGTALYQELLLEAVRVRQGQAPRRAAPVVRVGMVGRIPADYVPEEDLRIGLYRRLARFETVSEVEAFAEELEDRFGPVPEEALALLAVARLRCVCGGQGVRSLEAGPKGAALELHDAEGMEAMAERLGGVVRDGRVVVALPGGVEGRVGRLIALLEQGRSVQAGAELVSS